jgi:hypothetical protein
MVMLKIKTERSNTYQDLESRSSWSHLVEVMAPPAAAQQSRRTAVPETGPPTAQKAQMREVVVALRLVRLIAVVAQEPVEVAVEEVVEADSGEEAEVGFVEEVEVDFAVEVGEVAEGVVVVVVAVAVEAAQRVRGKKAIGRKMRPSRSSRASRRIQASK